MPKIPFLPLAVNDIDTATWRFELAERGAYDIILNELWRHKGQGIPNDDKWVADLLRVHIKTYRSLKPTLFAEGFLSVKDNRIHQETLNAKYRRITRSSKGLSEGYKEVEQFENKAENQDKLDIEKNKKSNSNSNSNYNSYYKNSGGFFNSFLSGIKDKKDVGDLQKASDEYNRLLKIKAFNQINPDLSIQCMMLAERYNDYVSHHKNINKSYKNIFYWLEAKLFQIDYKVEISKPRDINIESLHKAGIKDIKNINGFSGSSVYFATLDGSVEILHNTGKIIEYIFKNRKIIETKTKKNN